MSGERMRAGTVEILSGLIVGLILFAAAMAGAAALKRYGGARAATPAARTGSEATE